MSDNYKNIISEPLIIDGLRIAASNGLSVVDLYDRYISRDKRINELLSDGMLLGELNITFLHDLTELVTIHLSSVIIKIDRIYKVDDQIIVDYNYLNEKDYNLLKDRKHKLVPRLIGSFDKDEIKNVKLITIDMRTV